MSIRFSVTDLKQWVYCPRIVYYAHAMAGAGRPTYKMREAHRAQELIEKLETRRVLAKYGFGEGRRRFDVWVDTEDLGLTGRIDLLIEGGGSVAVVDFKLTSGEPGENHRMQLAGYALLAEQCTKLACPRGFIYRIPDDRVFPVDITEGLRADVNAALVRMRNAVDDESLPEATPVRKRCAECEYQNYCADVW